MIKFLKLICLMSYLIFTNSFAMEKIFYILRSNSPDQMVTAQKAFATLSQNYKQIDMLISQAYQIDGNGLLWGFVDNDVMKLAKDHHIKLVVLVTNAGFNKQKVHEFLTNPNAQKHALDMLLTACEQNQYDGVQWDFEMVPLADKAALTAFYQKAAEILHQHKLNVSFAVAPVVAKGPMPSEFLKKVYENWQGAYDLEALGKVGDFVTVMAYNQHAGKTTPGPTAGINWVDAVIKHTLHYIPADKISLGIPIYSEYWTTSKNTDDPANKIEAHSIGISYEKANFLLNKYKAKLQWDDQDKNYFSFFPNNWLNDYIFLEDAKSFKEKIALANKYKLRGISVFCLGGEDPGIWQELNV